MFIKEKLNQHRRDFKAIYKCEHCEAEVTMCGYDDAYFHNSVIPNMKCESCGEKSGTPHKQMATKYPEGFQI